MLRSNWYGTVAFVGLILVFLGISSLISDWNASRGIFEYHHAKHEKGRAAERYCYSIGDTNPESDETGPNSQSSAADTPERKKYDLCQQWRMAKAAEYTAYYAGWQTLAAVVGAALLIVTTAAAVFAAVFAKEAAKAGADTVGEAQEMNAITRLSSERQIRAYVEVRDAHIAGVMLDSKPVATIGITNCGQTPAKQMRVKYVIRVGPPSVADYIRFGEIMERPSVISLAAGQPTTLQPEKRKPLARNEIEALRSGEWTIVVAGFITYRDVLGRCRRTVFKFERDPRRLNADKGALVASPKGNRST